MRRPRARSICARLAQGVLLACLVAPSSVWAANACIITDGELPGDVPRSGGIGGTGAPAQGGEPRAEAAREIAAENGGIGGTGAVASGGIGGTGQQAEMGGMGSTGIVGVITGFASVCINGLEVHFDTQTVVTRNANPAGLRDLAIGQFVSIEAGRGKAGLTANRIAVLDAVVGPVTRASNQGLQVLGQNVRVSAETIGTGAAALKVGDRVRVSGPRANDNAVVATRIERTDSATASVSGPASVGLNGALRVAGVPVTGARPSTPVGGREALAVGRWDGRQLVADKLELDPATDFHSSIRQVVLEGFAAPGQKRDRVRIAGKEIQLSKDTAFAGTKSGEIVRDRPMRVLGRLGDDGVVQAVRIETRRELLPRGERGLRGSPEGRDRSESGSDDGTRGSGRDEGGGHGGDGRNERRDEGQRSDGADDSSGRGSSHDGRSGAQDGGKRDLDRGSGSSSGGSSRDERVERSSSSHGGRDERPTVERRSGGGRDRSRDH
ncbi:MAG TPA: DUF5666 domain-containing protein [Burkholderiales bacterium]|nr:DUF5666 domain-containing protein [Burkholderiales bacterium]